MILGRVGGSGPRLRVGRGIIMVITEAGDSVYTFHSSGYLMSLV